MTIVGCMSIYEMATIRYNRLFWLNRSYENRPDWVSTPIKALLCDYVLIKVVVRTF